MSTLSLQLIKAIKYDNLTKIKYLVENGADIHAQNDEALRSSAERLS